MDLCIVAGPASTELAKSIATILKAEIFPASLKVFPDGESKLTIEGEMNNRDVIIVQSTYPPADTHLMQLFFMIGKAREDARKIFVVVPYLAYARQDREFLKGEIISMKYIASLVSNIDKLITVDIHSNLALSYFNNAINVTAVPLLANHFKEMNLRDVIVASPDIGGISRAKEFAKIMESEAIALPKSRDRQTGEVTIDQNASISKVKGRNVIIVDDMISTGGSIIKATEALLKSECNSVFVACTHPILLNDAMKKILDAGVSEIIGTNTIPSAVSKVDIAPVICNEITRL